MKKMVLRMLSLALCAALVCVPALAAGEKVETPETPARLGTVRVWGAVTRQDENSLLVKNSTDDPNGEIIVHLSEETAVVDAVSGLPMDPAAIRDGSTVYAWVGPAMTMSLPPQSTATVVVGNIPADFAVPQYYEVSSVTALADETGVTLTTVGGDTLTVPAAAQFTPWLTKNAVSIRDLVPGARILVWTDLTRSVNRVLVFPYAYRGNLTWTADGAAILDGLTLDVAGRTVDGVVYLPLRAVAEHAGCQVSWDQKLGAVVRESGSTAAADGKIFSALPGAETVQTPDGDRGLYAPCFIDSGVTYLPAENLAELLNLFA